MAGAGGNMMAGFLTEGYAESSFGVCMSGFHAPSREFLGRLQTVLSHLPNPAIIAQSEQEGNITFVASENVYSKPDTGVRISTYRREPHKFFSELSPFLRSIRAAYVEKIVVTESLGSVQMSLLYYPAPGTDEPGV